MLRVAFALLSTVVLADDFTRSVNLRWAALESAFVYEAEVSANPTMKPPLQREETKKTEWKVTLKPGKYFFHVRGKDAMHGTGPWSDVQEFQIQEKVAETKRKPTERELLDINFEPPEWGKE